MKKFVILAIVLSPLAANAATVGRATSANDLSLTTTSFNGISNNNIFTTYHDQSKVNSDQGNVDEDYKQLNADQRSGDAMAVAEDKNAIASDRAKVSGDYSTYNTGNNTGVYSTINHPVAITHTDTYHQNSYRHHHDEDDE